MRLGLARAEEEAVDVLGLHPLGAFARVLHVDRDRADAERGEVLAHADGRQDAVEERVVHVDLEDHLVEVEAVDDRREHAVRVGLLLHRRLEPVVELAGAPLDLVRELQREADAERRELGGGVAAACPAGAAGGRLRLVRLGRRRHLVGGAERRRPGVRRRGRRAAARRQQRAAARTLRDGAEERLQHAEHAPALRRLHDRRRRHLGVEEVGDELALEPFPGRLALGLEVLVVGELGDFDDDHPLLAQRLEGGGDVGGEAHHLDLPLHAELGLQVVVDALVVGLHLDVHGGAHAEELQAVEHAEQADAAAQRLLDRRRHLAVQHHRERGALRADQRRLGGALHLLEKLQPARGLGRRALEVGLVAGHAQADLAVADGDRREADLVRDVGEGALDLALDVVELVLGQ